jgi:phosphoserine/homoserine phosphotransferase
MIREADGGCLFRAPENIRRDCAEIPCVDTYGELLAEIDEFLAG